MIARLEVENGIERGRQFLLLDHKPLTAGGGLNDDVLLPGRSWKPQSYAMGLREERLWICPLGAGPVAVEGKEPTDGPVEVSHLARFSFGETRFRYMVDGWREPSDPETVIDRLLRMGPLLLGGCRILATMEAEERKIWRGWTEITEIEAPGGIDHPYLMEWPQELRHQRGLLRGLWGTGRAMFVRSDLGTDALVDEFRDRAWLKAPDGELVPFRYFDPRVVRLLWGRAPEEWRQRMYWFLAEIHLEAQHPDEMRTFNVGAGKTFVTRLG